MAEDYRAALRKAMDGLGLTAPADRAALAAICGGESEFKPVVEAGYAHTSNARIRQIFRHRVPADDAELDALKADDRAFFDRVYGGRGGNRPGTEDGYTYRGHGPVQLTFRNNFAAVGRLIGRDIVADPDLLLRDAALSAASAVGYIKLNYRGGGFEAMLACVGQNIPSIAARKRAYYRKFLASGEFA